MKKLIIKFIVYVTCIFTLTSARTIVYNQAALLQMQNSNQAFIIMDSFSFIYHIVIYGLGFLFVRDIYKTFILKEKNK